MSSTTLRIDDPLLSELKKILPPRETVSSYVRELLERDIRRKRMADAAEAYLEFLRQHPEEGTDLEAWEKAPLDRPARKRGKG